MTRSSLSSSLFGLALCAGLGNALALGIVKVPHSAVLGQNLNVGVELRLTPGESLPGNCIQAEVIVGEQRLAPSTIRATLEGSTLRIVTSEAVSEPVVEVRLALGCVGKITRSFILLADPPGSQIAIAPSPAALVAPPVAAAPASTAATVNEPATPPVAAVPGAGGPPQTSLLAQAQQTSQPAASETQSRSEATAPASPRRSQASPRAKTRPAASPERVARPRLKLDAPDLPSTASKASPAPTAPLPAIPQTAALASAPGSDEEAAAQLDAQLKALEDTVALLLAEAKATLAAQQAAEAERLQLQQSLAQAQERAHRTAWLQGGVVLLGVALAVALWRLRVLRPKPAKWYQPAAEADAEKPVVTRTTASVDAVAAGAQAGVPADATMTSAGTKSPAYKSKAKPVFPLRRGQPDAEQPAPANQAAASASAAKMSDTQPAEDLSATKVLSPAAVARAVAGGQANPEEDGAVAIEELIDLEQQVAFFTLLGQDDAAVDLIVAHLRSGAVSSPLPYLKLLELHQRQGDAAAYERTRSRFEKRFAASAPAWGEDLNAGRTLEQYPRVMQRVQAVWAQPLDAMALLQTLLARTEGGEMFDLPAYRDLMLLYPIARNLAGLGTRKGELDVDLLLPLGEAESDTDRGVFRTTTALPYRAEDGQSPGWESRPTAPVDLELDIDSPAPRR